MKSRVAGIVALVFSLCGCVTTQGGYQWGNYEQDLYDYLHSPEQKKRVVENQLAFIARCERLDLTPAPGLYAEVGTLLLLDGRREQAIDFYAKERDTWPESEYLMTTIISNLEKEAANAGN
ncbi:MAG TPA: DUF4810 domain-containing protein [Marinagarivorans sp.]